MWFVNIAVILLVASNIHAFVLMGVDKRRAKRGQWRISEKRLLLSALCFGAAGALLGMKRFRHKTQHMRFRIGIPILLIAQIAIIGALGIKYIQL